MSIPINRLQHVGIPVTNLAVSIAFYERLDFKNMMQTTFIYEGETGHVAMMQRDDIVIELYEMPEPEKSRIKERTNGHVDHIAFDVDDVDAVFHQLKAEGFNVIESSPVFLQFWQKGCKFCFITGPNGERLEFCEIIK